MRQKPPSSLYVLLVAFILLLAGPLIYGFYSYAQQEKTAAQFSIGSAEVLLRTIKICGGAATLSLLTGCALSFCLLSLKKPFLTAVMLTALLLPFFLPQYLIGLSWSLLLDRQGLFEDFGLLTTIMSSSVMRECLVMIILAITAIPFSVVAFYFLLEKISTSHREASIIFLSRWQAWKVIIMGILPSIVALFILIFIYLLSDFSVADLFQVRLVSTEIFAAISTRESIDTVYLYSFFGLIPVISVIVLLAMRSQQAADNSSAHRNALIRPSVVGYRGAHHMLLFVFAFLIGLPIFNLFFVAGGISPLLLTLNEVAGSILDSFILATIVASASIVFGLIVSATAFSSGHRYAILLRSVLLCLFLVPGSVLSIALLFGWQPMLGSMPLSVGLVIPVVALVLKLGFIATEWIYSGLVTVPRSVEESGAMFFSNWYLGQSRVILPILKSNILGAGLVVFVLTVNDVGITLLTLPPGFSTLSQHLYSYIHYGPESLVASVSLIHLTVVLIPAILCSWVIAGRLRK